MLNQTTRICFIFNPAANRNRSLQHIDWLRQQASTLWKNYEIVIPEEGESLIDLTQSKSKSFDVIVACGGDGTVSQIINGLVESDTALGVLPIGSGNDFVKSLNLNKSLPECLKIIHQNYTTNIDLIRYEGDAEGWCANTIGMGVDGLANFYAHQTSLKGRIRYYVGALKAILRFRGCRMEIVSNKLSSKDDFVMVTICNGKWEGGSFLVAPNADISDGRMDLLTIKKTSNLMLLLYLLSFRWGPGHWMTGVKTFRSKSLEVSATVPVAVHRDGEHLGTNIQYLKFTVEQSAVKVLTQKNY